jgi:hypothetical protein
MTVEKPSPEVRDVLTKAAARAMDEVLLFVEEDRAKEASTKTAERILFQDPVKVSKRVWSVVLMALSLVMMDPDVQQALLSLLPAFVPVKYLPAAGVLAAAVLTFLSKALDPRVPKTRAAGKEIAAR